jgi:thymidylate synthase (FAD)
MRIVAPSVEVLRTGLEKEFMTPEQFIERVGRTCYKSKDKITTESAPKFVRNLINRGHEAMIEHWTLIFRVKNNAHYESIMNYWAQARCCDDEYCVSDDAFLPKIRFTDGYDNDRYIVSGNVRAWRDFVRGVKRSNANIPGFLFEVMDTAPVFFEDLRPADTRPEGRTPWLTPITVKDLEGDLEHLVHHDVTLKFVCDRGVSHELVRHRAASFAQESTRYCNYASGKYGSEITVVRPSLCAEGTAAWNAWLRACLRTEDDYVGLVMSGAKPQEARSVLNNSLKTEVIVTGTMGHWHHFFGLRCGPEAQPGMREVACMARDILQSALNDYMFDLDCEAYGANANTCET